MKKLMFMMSVMTMITMFFSCSQLEEDNELNPIIDTSLGKESPLTFDSEALQNGLELFSKHHLYDKSNQSVSIILEDDFTTVVDGQSMANRNSKGITMNFKAQNPANLDATGHAVTLWAVFFKPGVEIRHDTFHAIYHVSGQVVGNNGHLNFSGRINKGDMKGLAAGDPLEDPMNDVLMLVLKTHGEADTEILKEQLSTMDGGCDGDGPDPAPPCYEFLFSFHF